MAKAPFLRSHTGQGKPFLETALASVSPSVTKGGSASPKRKAAEAVEAVAGLDGQYCPAGVYVFGRVS